MDNLCPVCGGPEHPIARHRHENLTECRDRLAARVVELEADLERLKADYIGGDQESQAMAWSAVYRALEKAGLLSFLPTPLMCPGRDRAVQFVAHLAAERDDLRRRLESSQKDGEAWFEAKIVAEKQRDAAERRATEAEGVVERMREALEKWCVVRLYAGTDLTVCNECHAKWNGEPEHEPTCPLSAGRAHAEAKGGEG